MTKKALELCELLGLEAGIPEGEMHDDGSGRPDHIWDDWRGVMSGGPINGQWRSMRAVAGGAALGDVACLLRLRSAFGLPPFV